MDKYKVEGEFLALNPERIKFMLLSREDVSRCKADPVGA